MRRPSEANAMRLELYLVADSGQLPRAQFLDSVEAALAGGTTAVQLRSKLDPPADLLQFGAEIRRMTRRRQALFMVNDRVDLALALEADGTHVGQEDLPALAVRRLMPRPALLGVSAGTVEAALAAERDGADYLGVGPVFPTATKSNAGNPIGLAVLSAIAGIVRIPVVGIGGINADNAASVIAAGTAGVAVVSAILGSRNPEGAAREILARVEEAKALRGTERGELGEGRGRGR